MNRKTTKTLSDQIISAEIPSLSYEAKASMIDYAANSLNQSSCYTGNQYLESNVDFKKLYRNQRLFIGQSLLSQLSQIERMYNAHSLLNQVSISSKHLNYQAQRWTEIPNITYPKVDYLSQLAKTLSRQAKCYSEIANSAVVLSSTYDRIIKNMKSIYPKIRW